MRIKARIPPRGLQIINLMKAGKSNKLIGYELAIAEKTVKDYCWQIYRILGVNCDRELLSLIIDLRPEKSDAISQYIAIDGYTYLTILHSILK